jgi:5-methyltetrahydrofolate--homocysteine methyltransferase
MPDFRKSLNSGRLLLMDGAMGTELQQAGLRSGECHELWNLTHPDRVLAIHQAYLEAGAECLVTNSIQANPAALARFGLQGQLHRLNEAAVTLARSAGAQDHFVLGSIGPMALTQIENDMAAVVQSLQDADALLLETWSEGLELAVKCALDPVTNPRQLPVILSLAFCKLAEPERTIFLPGTGLSAAGVASFISKTGIVALGANCGRDMELQDMAEVLRAFRAVTDLPLLARPNAGTPLATAEGWSYPRSPTQMAAGVMQLIQSGARMIGGCCGTTPSTIEAFVGTLASQFEGRSG